VALRARTGEVAWGFQLVHHDLWTLIVRRRLCLLPCAMMERMSRSSFRATRLALLYVLNRDTGKPVFPVEERPVPQSDVPGEVTSPTQPFPLAPPLWPQRRFPPRKPGDRRQRIARLVARQSRSCATKEFSRRLVLRNIDVPGNIGGMTWSGYAFDPRHSLLVTNTNNIVALARLIHAPNMISAARTPKTATM